MISEIRFGATSKRKAMVQFNTWHRQWFSTGPVFKGPDLQDVHIVIGIQVGRLNDGPLPAKADMTGPSQQGRLVPKAQAPVAIYSDAGRRRTGKPHLKQWHLPGSSVGR